MTLEPTLFLLNRTRLRPKWLLQRLWTLLQDCQVVLDKQLMQYQRALKPNWRTLTDCQKFPNQNVQIVGYVFHDTNGRIMGKNWKSRESLERNLYGHPLCLQRKTIRTNFIRIWMEKIPNWECMFVHRKKIIFIVYANEIKLLQWSRIWFPCGRHWWKIRILTWSCLLVIHSAWMQIEWSSHWTTYEDNWITYFCWSNRKITGVTKTSRTDSSVNPRLVRTCSKMYQLNKIASLYPDDYQFKQEELESVGELSKVCSHIVLLTCCGQSQSLQLTRSVAKLTQTCNRRLTRLIFYIHHTKNSQSYCRVGITTQHCRLFFSIALTLLTVLRNQNQSQDVFSVFLEIKHSSQSTRWVTKRLSFFF